MRVLSVLGLLAVAAFCAFGFAATFEPVAEGFLIWRIGYGAAILLCLPAVLRALTKRGARS